MDEKLKRSLQKQGHTFVEPEPEPAECWVLQHRVKGRSQGEWGAWSTSQDYRRKETATKECARQRSMYPDTETGPKIEWRVLHVTQEVVY